MKRSGLLILVKKYRILIPKMMQLVCTSILCLCFLNLFAKEYRPDNNSSRTISRENIIAENSTESGTYTISSEDGKAILSAGIMQRILHVSKDGVFTTSLTVDNESLISFDTEEVSFRISKAEPNREPGTSNSGNGGALNIEATEKQGTDALNIKNDEKKSGEAVDWSQFQFQNREKAGNDDGTEDLTKWVEQRVFTGKTWSSVFNHQNIHAYQPSPGVTRLIVRTRSLNDETLAGLAVNLVYEVYDGYPVIRKWIEFRNNSKSWIKIDSLTIDDIRLTPEFLNQTALTPGERGAGPSIIAFSNQQQSRGVIVASEIPSALRQIKEQGASGYAPEYFEWVLGPAEHFVSEPTFTYAFSGEVIKTASALSLPLDRAVESGFKRFQYEHLGISPGHIEIPAPEWATWTNFGPEITETIVREQAKIAAECGFVLFELDDGWQRGRLGIEPDPEKFPNMYETAAYVRSLGLRLGLWISCFRMPDEKDFEALPNAHVNPKIKRLDGLAMGFTGSWREYYGNDMVFLRDYYGATYFKQDFTNIKFGDLGAGSDARTGKESLLRGLRGLFESQDILRRQAPDVANQITHEIYWGTPGVPADLAALKHASLYHIPPNDYSGVGHWKKRVGTGDEWDSYDPQKMREQLINGCYNARNRFYAHRGLPLECIEYYGAATVNWKGSLSTEVQDRQVCSWLMGAPLLFAGDLASLTRENINHYHKRFVAVKRLQSEYGIYRHFQYSGVPAPTEEGWHWWGKLNEEGKGAVVVIRGKEGPEIESINIPWVDRNREYMIKPLFSGKEPLSFTGAELQDGALKLELPVMGQEILEIW
jgi:hypothetical protein